MGQKTNPIGFRLGVTRDHRSKWYANRDFPALLKEDGALDRLKNQGYEVQEPQ